MWGLDLHPADRIRGDGSVEVGIVDRRRRRQDLHGLKVVPEPYRAESLEGGDQIAVQREAGHLGAVSVVIVRSPGRLAGMDVGDVQRCGQQGVLAIDAGVQHTHCGCPRSGALSTVEQLGDPVGLLDSTGPAEELGGDPGPTELGKVVEEVNRGCQLRGRSADQDDGAVVKHEVSIANLDTEALREAAEAAKLGAVTAAQPHLPPHDHVRGGEVVGVGPKRLDGGQPNGRDPFDEVAVPGRAGWRALGRVLLEALHEVTQLSVGHKHRRTLHDLIADHHALYGEELRLRTRALRIKRGVLQVEARKAIEYDVNPIASRGDAYRLTGLSSTYLTGGGGGFGGASKRLAVGEPVERSRRPGALSSGGMRRVRVGLSRSQDKYVGAVAGCHRRCRRSSARGVASIPQR